MHWTITTARMQFARVLALAAKAPQKISNRGRVQAVVIDADTFEAFERWRAAQPSSSLAEALQDLQRVCAAERYVLPTPKRADRKNPFAEALE